MNTAQLVVLKAIPKIGRVGGDYWFRWAQLPPPRSGQASRALWTS